MNRKIVHSDESRAGREAKLDLAAPLGNRDACLAPQSGQNTKLKRKPFKLNIMAREAKKNRPIRKIKLNRNIFNAGFQGKPTFHVKTLGELKSERQEAKETSDVSTLQNTNDESCNSTTTTSTSTVVGAKQTLTQNTTIDTRKVLTLNTPKKLMLPTIQLTRISSGNYSRSVSRSSTPGNMGRIRRSEAVLRRFGSSEMSERNSVNLSESIIHSHQTSPAKKRKVIPSRSPESTTTSTLSNDAPWSTDFDMLHNVPSSLEQPPSPALSLGAQSDDDLHADIEPQNMPDERVVISTTNMVVHDSKQKGGRGKSKPVLFGSVLKSQGSCVKQWNNFVMSSSSGVDTPLDNDKLDVMSVFADDDELFQDDKPKLKRSLSEDSVFNMSNSQDDCVGDLRSLLKNDGKEAKSNIQSMVGEIISAKPLSKSFKIPFCNQNGGNFVNGPNNRHDNLAKGGPQRQLSGTFPPRGPAQLNHPHNRNYLAGMNLSLQLVGQINQSLRQGHIVGAWTAIQNLDQLKCGIDKRLLEEMLKVCERVSRSSPTPTPGFGDAVLGCFEIIKRQGDVRPTDYIITILSLCRCQRVSQALSTYKDMRVSRRMPPPDMLGHFVKDFCKALVFSPGAIIEIVHDVLTFPLAHQSKMNMVNSCISFLISAQQSKLREINAYVWDKLLTLLCKAPASNVQSASQVHTLMNQYGVPLTPAASTQLIRLYLETHSTNLLLNLLSLKATKDVLKDQKVASDVAYYLLNAQVDSREIYNCFTSMLDNGNMPAAELLQAFIQKAALVKDYNLIYHFFLRCEKSMLPLPVLVLKRMMDALDNWDENTDASVQVYAALRKARKVEKQTSVNPPKDSDKPVANNAQTKVCSNFRQTGICRYGDRCDFAHVRQNSRHSSNESDHSGRGSNRESQSKKDDGKSQPNSMSVSVGARPGVLGSPPAVDPLITNPFSTLQVPNSGFAPQLFNQQLFDNKMRNTRPPLNPQSQENTLKPRFYNPGPNQPCPPSTSLLNTSKQQVAPCPSTPPPQALVKQSKFYKLNRSFSWEPPSEQRNTKPARHNSWKPHRSPGMKPGKMERNNNGKILPEKQLRIETAIRSSDWQFAHACYLECKGADDQHVQNKDLLLFRNGFSKDVTIGEQFNAFVEFMYKENNSGRSCHSTNSHSEVFDQYDIDFIGGLGVSLMERCLVLKHYEEGYKVLLGLHSHNVSYFHSGLNFGAYTKNIPPTHVALIAVKLCLGVEKHGPLGAMVVLRACDYALAEHDEVMAPDEEEYRTRVLSQLFVKLFDEGHIPEAYEIIQNLNASMSVAGPMYRKVFNYYVDQDELDKSLVVLDEMQEKGHECYLLYEKVLKYCIEKKQYDKGVVVVRELEDKGISISGQVQREMLNAMTSHEEMLAKVLFKQCNGLDVYPKTFCNNTPWLCELGCDYSEIELTLLIQNHLNQVHEYLLLKSGIELLSNVRDLEIILFPRLASESGLKCTDGIQNLLTNVAAIVEKILQYKFNPPLAIREKSGEHFHKKIIVEKMTVYRWFSANTPDMQRLEDNPEEDEVLSQISLGSDISDLG